MGDGSTWSTCLVATVDKLAAALADKVFGCLLEPEPAMSALCHVLACAETAPLWLKALLAHPDGGTNEGELQQKSLQDLYGPAVLLD